MAQATQPVAAGGPLLVAHVVYRFDVGGLENGVVNLINRMPADRWRHAVVALTEIAEPFRARIGRPDVTYVALAKKPGHLFAEYPRLYRLFRTLAPAIVHTRNLAALEASVPAWLARVPVRVHGEHGWDVHDPAGKRRRYQLVRRAYRPFVSKYIALSRDIESYLEHKVGVPADAVRQIYNGVDADRFHPAAGARERIAGCPFADPAHWLVGTVGRFESVKDQLNLARAFVAAHRLDPQARRRMRLVLVGDGSLRPEIEAILAAGGVRDSAWFAGERGDVPAIMRGLDCFVLPSLSEGVSNTILEAMASGLPVVATRVGGNGELIEHDMTGALVPAGNSDALAGAILEYFRSPATARRHGKAARRVVERRFSLDRMVADYGATYEAALRAAGVPVPLGAAHPRATPSLAANGGADAR
ncbi:MAG: TIGR03088 family PEP-CTERM/XrtA system glycosyltransferase [Burkholderiales bacterium]|nr:TIGR03088 family PEP-CTERM/XrtA system glycosyltransferase [Burkholderiales bacterium]